MGADRVLYWGSGSGPCWRVQIALAEKALEYDSKLLEFSQKGHKSPEVLALNPRGQLPAFKDGDVVVNESLAAIIYLEETYDSGTQLLPKDAKAKAQVWQRLMEAPNLQEAGRNVAYAKMSSQPVDDAEFEGKLEALRKELAHWERYLADNKFIAGADFSLADVAIAPLIMQQERFGATFGDKFPNLQAYADTLRSRPSVKDNTPPHWLEGPGKDWLASL